MKWICCQLGAREHYAIPRALSRQGSLDQLLTDAWVPPGSPLAALPFGLRERFHPDLSAAPVQAWNSRLLAFELAARLKRLTGWPLILARNYWFQRKVVTYLSSSQLSVVGSQPILFAYSYAARDIFRFAKAQGWKTVLGQIDLGPVEEEIVRTEHEIHPEFVSDWRSAPSKYWQNWRQELELADKILVNSDWARTALERSGVNQQKLAVIPLAYQLPADDSPTTHEYPERFTPEREKQLRRYAYLPFGAGPRICLGLYFAMMEGHLLLATLAQRISFSLVPGQTIVPDPVHHLTLRPAGSVNVVVKRR